jgi:alkylation response protein AidB-like acyl-CoA dehydrogenase
MYYDESQDFLEFTNELGEMGFMGITFPRNTAAQTYHYGICYIVEEISKADPRLGLLLHRVTGFAQIIYLCLQTRA